MRVVSVEARDFRSWRHFGPWTVPDGPTAILGRNGSGKSSLLTAIDLGLFGARTLEPSLSYLGGSHLQIILVVDHDGCTYRVRRGYDGHKSTLDFEVCASGPPGAQTWEPLTLAKQTDTQTLIETTFGLTRSVFRASAFIAQGDTAALTSARPAERMEILRATIGDLDQWAAAHGLVKADRKQAEQDATRLTGIIDGLTVETARRPEVEQLAAALATLEAEQTTALAAAEQQHEQATVEYQHAQTLTGHVETCRAAHAAADAEHRRLAAITTAAESARDEHAGLTDKRAALARVAALLPDAETREEELRQQVEGHRRAIAEHDAAARAQGDAANRATDLYKRADAALAKRDTLKGHSARVIAAEAHEQCDRCGQELGHKAALRASASYLADAKVAEENAAALRAEAAAIVIPIVGEPPAGEPPLEALRQASAAVETARTARHELATLDERAAGLQRTIATAETPEHQAAVEAADEALAAADAQFVDAMMAAAKVDTGGIKQAGLTARATVNHTRQTLDDTRAQAAVAKNTLARLDEADQQLATHRAEHDRLTTDAHQLALLERAFGPQGVPLLVVENAVPAIEQAANTILRRLGGETEACTIELRTQKALKTGEARDTLDIVIHVPAHGVAVDYEQWSGGEKTRIDLALRIGLAQLLLQAGANVELFALDEPEGLDREARAALVQIIDEMSGLYGFSSVLLISHDDGLRDSFTQTLEVGRTDGGPSHVVTTDVLEPVAA